jgi:hypothetical protein
MEYDFWKQSFRTVNLQPSPLRQGESSVADNFVFGDDGGIARSGNVEASEAEDESDDVPVPLGQTAQENRGVALSRPSLGALGFFAHNFVLSI